MSHLTKAIIAGRPTVAEIAAIVSATHADPDSVSIVETRMPHYHKISFLQEGERRVMDVFADQGMDDDRHVYDGQRVILHMGFDPRSQAVLRAVLDVHGGFLQPDDAVEEGWFAVPRTAAVPTLPPLDRLKLALNDIGSPGEAMTIARLATDPTRLEGLISALEEYRSSIPGSPAP